MKGNEMNILHVAVFLVVFAAVLGAQPWQTAAGLPPQLQGVGLDQRLNNSIPLEATFHDEQGTTVALRQYFYKRPVILTLVYYQCPMLCNRILEGLVTSLKGVGLDPGKDFEIVTVSFNPRETPALAAAKKQSYLRLYGDPAAGSAWHFLTGGQPDIDRLAKAVGFRYSFDPQSGQYAHPSAIMVLTPGGRLARYFYGIDYPSRDLRLGLVEASAGKIGSPVDQVLLYCCRYDPATGKYGVVVWNVIRLTSFTVLALLSIFLIALFRRDRKPRLQDHGGHPVRA
jgi:protein SCO1/2